MTLAMADSIYVANLPPGIACYAGYTAGNWITYPALERVFPDAHLLSIAIAAGLDADCLDVEPGDAGNIQAPGWVMRQQRRGVTRPCVYTSAANMGALVGTLRSHGIARSQVRLWSAHYGLGPHICGPASCKYPGCPAADGTQWTSTGRGANGSLIDLSVLRDDFFDGGIMSATGPEKWDAKDWAAMNSHGMNVLWWLTRALTGDTTGTTTKQQALDVTKAHEALTAYMPPVEAIAKAVVAALPPAETGGLTVADVENAVRAVFAPAFTPPVG